MKKPNAQTVRFVVAQLALRRDERNYKRLMSLATRAVKDLLTRKETVTKAEKKFLYNIIASLYEYTVGNMAPETRDYANEHDRNTIDYKLAREIVLKYPKRNDVKFLQDVVNYYYYDNVLVSEGLHQLIAQDPIGGLCFAIEHAQALGDKSKKRMQLEYFSQLENRLDEPGVTYKNLKNLVSSRLMPFYIRKTTAKIILKKNLLDGAGVENKEQSQIFYKKVATAANKHHLSSLI